MDMWPPASPDLNHMDYYVRGILEKESNKLTGFHSQGSDQHE
uniref:Uncharacterized protein n=1 Tax=Lepeophtheirus salmonis TaxID=72036 RepID=A0A0K2TQ49_LEPSM